MKINVTAVVINFITYLGLPSSLGH